MPTFAAVKAPRHVRAGVIGGLAQDARYALRTWRRAPAATALAVVTLALGIGGSTALFTVIQAVLLRPLPFQDSDRLTMIQPSSGARLSSAYLDEWRRESRGFADLAGLVRPARQPHRHHRPAGSPRRPGHTQLLCAVGHGCHSRPHLYG
ncbi:MAG: hypothetical protein ACT4QD_18105 [Acidobacteriota bacterium]